MINLGRFHLLKLPILQMAIQVECKISHQLLHKIRQLSLDVQHRHSHLKRTRKRKRKNPRKEGQHQLHLLLLLLQKNLMTQRVCRSLIKMLILLSECHTFPLVIIPRISRLIKLFFYEYFLCFTCSDHLCRQKL